MEYHLGRQERTSQVMKRHEGLKYKLSSEKNRFKEASHGVTLNKCLWLRGKCRDNRGPGHVSIRGMNSGPWGTGRALSQSVRMEGQRSCSVHFSKPMGYTLRETTDSQMHDMSESAHWWAWYKHTSWGWEVQDGVHLCTRLFIDENHLYFLLKFAVDLKLVLNKNH